MRRWFSLVVLCAGCRVAKLALLPPINSPGSSNDPDLTRPLVESNQPSPYSSTENAPGRAAQDPVVVGPVSVGLSAAAALLYLLGGAAPSIGMIMTFEENDVASRKASPSRHARAEVPLATPEQP